MKGPRRLHWQNLAEGPELIADLGAHGWAISEKDGCMWYPITTSRLHLRTIRALLRGSRARVKILPI
jgi:hypothetical protein